MIHKEARPITKRFPVRLGEKSVNEEIIHLGPQLISFLVDRDKAMQSREVCVSV
jgi:hypothetical protein